MDHVPIDDYVLDVLLPDLAGHDHTPSAMAERVLMVYQAALESGKRKRGARRAFGSRQAAGKELSDT